MNNRKEKILRYEEEIQKKEEARKEFDARCEERIKQLRGMIAKERTMLKKEEDARIAAAVRAAATVGEDIDSLLARILGANSGQDDEVIDYNESFGDMPQEYLKSSSKEPLEEPMGEPLKESETERFRNADWEGRADQPRSGLTESILDGD